ncbi:hypothetical protein Micau_1854 [Micromonospora aurantiaca ATCC 27029]|nr:hypothetical protein Micau_1854 [Micromonospora aurantiaca ATCC 27029]
MLALAWTGWLPLDDRAVRLQVPRGPGLYQVRRIGDSALAYVGQTAELRRRLGQLCVLYRDEMPYNDPHTAAPCLWVMRTADGAKFEFSLAEFAGDIRERRLAECVVLSRHRARFGRSPTANFGRVPDGWVKSTGNNAALVRAGRRARGYQDSRASRPADQGPVLDLGRAPMACDWAQLPWSSWSSGPVAEAVVGVYRIRRPGQARLVYIGQGLIRARLAAHAAKSQLEGHRQRTAFSQPLESSWARLPGCSPTQLLEIECDLIASHALTTGFAPEAQFLG